MDPVEGPSIVQQALPVLSAAVQSVVQVLLLAAGGAYLERIGQMGRLKRSAISTVAYRILLPCLLFANVSESISIERMKRLWVMPLYAVIYTACGSVLGWLAGRFVIHPTDEFAKPHMFLTCAIGNYAYVPLVLLPAVILQGALHAPGTDLPAEVRKAAGYVSLFIPFINFYTFGVGGWILKAYKRSQDRAEQDVLASSRSLIGPPHNNYSSSSQSAGQASHAAHVDERDSNGLVAADGSESGSGYDDRPLGVGSVSVPIDGNVVAGSSIRYLIQPHVAATDTSALGAVNSVQSARASSSAAAPLPPSKGLSDATAEKLIPLFKRFALSLPEGQQEAAASVLEVLQVCLEPPIIATIFALFVGLIPDIKALLWVKDKAASVAPPQPIVAGGCWTADLDLAGLAGPQGSSYTQLTTYPYSTMRLVRNDSQWLLCADSDGLSGGGPPDASGTSAFALAGQVCYVIGAAVAALPIAVSAASSAAASAIGSVVTAPLGPTVASAAQSFAGAVSPMVAIMMGSSIVEQPQAPPPSSDSSSNGAMSPSNASKTVVPAAVEAASGAPVVRM